MSSNKTAVGLEALRLAAAVIRRWNALDPTSKAAFQDNIDELKVAVRTVQHESFAYAGHLGPRFRKVSDERLLKKANAQNLEVQLGRRILHLLLVAEGQSVAIKSVANELSLESDDLTLASAISLLRDTNLVDRDIDALSFRTVDYWYRELPALRSTNIPQVLAQDFALQLTQHGVLAVGDDGIKGQDARGLKGTELTIAVGAALSLALTSHGMEWYGLVHKTRIVGLPRELLESFTKPLDTVGDGSLSSLMESVQHLLAVGQRLWVELPKTPSSASLDARYAPQFDSSATFPVSFDESDSEA